MKLMPNKKTLSLIILLLLSGEEVGSAPKETPKPITFIYIHGNNFNNDCLRDLFISKTESLHKEIKSSFEHRLTEPAIGDHLLKSGKYKIAEQPLAFYWGDLPQAEVEFLNKQLDLTKGTSIFAQKARVLVSTVLHDAIWLEKSSRRKEVLNRLVDQMRNKNDFVLLGHSGGSLVANQFVTQRISFLSLSDYCHGMAINELFIDRGTEEDKAISKINQNLYSLSNQCKRDSKELEEILNLTDPHVCTDAASYIGLVKTDPRHSAILQPDISRLLNELKTNPQKVLEVKETIDKTCIAKTRFKGMVTFGSPLPIFASVYMANIYEPQNSLSSRYEFIDSVFDYFLKYISQSNSFWIHINHLDDPIGIAIDDETLMKIAEENNSPSTIGENQFEGGKGFIFSTSSFFQRGFKGKRYLKIERYLNPKKAHLWYWNKPSEFAKFLVEAYLDGHRVKVQNK